VRRTLTRLRRKSVRKEKEKGNLARRKEGRKDGVRHLEGDRKKKTIAA